MEQFQKGGNMTDVIAALANLANIDCPEREEALAEFYEKWKHDPLVMDKWLAIQAGSSPADDAGQGQGAHTPSGLLHKKSEQGARPDRRLLQGNPVRFHDPGGAGYAFLADHGPCSRSP